MLILLAFEDVIVKRKKGKNKLSKYKKIIHYWTDWHIVNHRLLVVSNVTRCSNNNHGLSTAKDSVCWTLLYLGCVYCQRPINAKEKNYYDKRR